MAASHSIHHPSLSPPHQSQYNSTNKRDRKRIHIESRIKDIAANLSANRDVNLRTQLNSIQRDIVYITRAELYIGTRLKDHPEDLIAEVANVNVMGVVLEAEPSKFPLGRHAVKFAERVNNAMDERDGNIANLQRQFLNRLDSFKREYDFSVQVAAAEEQALKDTAKHRVVSALQARRKALQKDREILDSSDINAMLHGAGIILTAPGSPGPHNNRKTRHGGRHTKQEQDNQETTESAKRKRRQDFDESPGPGSRNLIGTTSWTRDIPTPGDSDVAKYFSPKDLSLHYRQANTIVAESWVERKPIRTNGIPQLMNGHHENGRYNGVQESGDDEEIDTSALVAPAMDRTGSHATRSTRNNQTDITLARDTFEALKNPERMYGLAVIEALGPRQPKAAKADLEAPWTPSLTSAEIMEDRAYLDTL